jgi:serine/threonine protein kinase
VYVRSDADEIDKIVRLLGQGTFGKVVEARNVESRRKVAIKVIRAVQKYRDASKIEIRVLETLRRHDPGNTKYVHYTIIRLTIVIVFIWTNTLIIVITPVSFPNCMG